MPRREPIREIPSLKAQGKGSWVKFKAITYGEREVLRDESKEHQNDENTDWAVEQEKRLFTEHIVGWNWVDTDGSPLPVPSEDPEVIMGLTDAEYEFLLGLFQVSQNPKKE